MKLAVSGKLTNVLAHLSALIRQLAIVLLIVFSSMSTAFADAPAGTVANSSTLRIVSLGGEVTEMIYALGLGKSIVAVDTTSNWPIEVKSLPRVGYLRALSAEGVLSMSPTLVIANEGAGPPTVVRQLKESGVAYYTLEKAMNFEAVINNINKLGKILGRTLRSDELSRQLSKQAKIFSELQTALQTVKHEKPDVLFLLSAGAGGPMASGRNTSADAMINLAGGSNAMTAYEGFKPIGVETIVAAQPDVILLTERTLKMLGGIDKVVKLPGLSHTPAGKNRRIIAMDGMYMLGFGPRVIDAATDLSALLN